MIYKMLMRNVRTLADYERPTDVITIDCERLIVERHDVGGAFLTITEAGKCDPSEVDPPPKLPLGNTMVGTLIRTDQSRDIETFIFNRAIPKPLRNDLPSAFFPLDGCVDVRWKGDKADLKASGRHLHDLSETGVVIHKPEPFADCSDGKTWLFDAVRVPWASSQNPHKQEA